MPVCTQISIKRFFLVLSNSMQLKGIFSIYFSLIWSLLRCLHQSMLSSSSSSISLTGVANIFDVSITFSYVGFVPGVGAIPIMFLMLCLASSGFLNFCFIYLPFMSAIWSTALGNTNCCMFCTDAALTGEFSLHSLELFKSQWSWCLGWGLCFGRTWISCSSSRTTLTSSSTFWGAWSCCCSNNCMPRFSPFSSLGVKKDSCKEPLLRNTSYGLSSELLELECDWFLIEKFLEF